MKFDSNLSSLLLSAVVVAVVAQDTAQNATSTFVAEGTCVFPVELFLSNTCSQFWSNGRKNITADGQCHSIPPSEFTDKVDPGPYYRAECDNKGQIKFLAAECVDAGCTQCERFSAYVHGPTEGIFDMTLPGCQNLLVSSFISFGPLQVKVDTGVPVTSASPVTGPTTAPVGAISTTTPVASPTRAPVASPTTAPVAPTSTTAPVTVSTMVPAVAAEACSWSLRYYNRTASGTTTTSSSCGVVNLVEPQQRASIIADGQCRNSSITSVGFYQAMCDASGGIVFLKNKCVDATCSVCDSDADIYTGTAYASTSCYDHDADPLKAWVLRGSCEPTSCAQMTTTLPPQSGSSFSFTALP